MTSSGSFQEKARAFLAISPQFRLGELVTEQPHPLTGNLSDLAVHDLHEALSILHSVDAEALNVLRDKCLDRIVFLAQRIKQTLETGNSVFLCGCGATGRLSLTCETLWHRLHQGDVVDKRVIAFMAGGDTALVRSIEDFEDHADYGARQLRELGFGSGDLLISCTEGGETPFVIGATLLAAETSDNPPFFLYCNPDEILCRVAERSLRIINDNRIEKVNCTVGPMAITGSTRMQASTALMAAVGHALLCHAEPEKIKQSIDALIDYWKNVDPGFLAQFIAAEANGYRDGRRVEYRADPGLAITILTDTTERSPTFSVHPFDNAMDTGEPHSQCSLFLPEAADSVQAWELILGRRPRTLSWEETGEIASYERLLGFDFSIRGREKSQESPLASQFSGCFSIKNKADCIEFDFEGYSHCLEVSGTDQLCRHLVLKMLLNMHSTLVMGRLGRFEGNVMTWVRPSNNKLIDRSIRYADFLLKKKGVVVSYEQLAHVCFELKETMAPDQSVVYALVNQFEKGLC